tara:strand:+ start:13383 stop:14690 length:1308 start_codon:yes stop_codon:yes gene_type:complete
MNEALKRIGEQKGWSDEETIKEFSEFIKENYPEIWTQAGGNLSHIEAEDYDFFSSAFEVNTVRRKGTGGKGETWVGMIVAYDGKRDMMQRQRDTAIDSAEINLGQALRYGIKQGEKTVALGRVTKSDTEWIVHSADDTIVYREDVKDETPLWVLEYGSAGGKICLLKDDGKTPKRAFMVKRKWLFIGNTQEKFLSEGALPPMTLECSFGAANVELQMLRPITFKAEMETAWKPAGSDEPDKQQLVALDIEPDYGLDWVDDELLPKVTQLFAPDQFIASFMPTVDLADVFDYHMEKRIILSSGKDFGPLFAISGTVDYIDHAGKENLYTEGGFKHAITLTSNSLRREDAGASLWVDVSRYLVDEQHAFKVKKADGWRDYASGSRVWVIVRSRTWAGTDGSLNMNLDAKSLYAMPLRSIVAREAPADANDISHTDGF